LTTTPEDLVWWLRTAPSLQWTRARTYENSAPHEYIVLDRTPGLNREDFQRIGRVIETFGEPGRFYRSTNLYLTTGQHRYWHMDPSWDRVDLVNRAINDRVYGVQNAPQTHNAAWTEFDSIATTYDADHPRAAERDEELIRRVIERFGTYRPTTLEIGSGTGAALDLGVTIPSRYTGVDPSQAMLNALVRKHPDVMRVIPARLDEIPDAMLSPSYELVIALDVPGLSEADRERMRNLGSEVIEL